MPYAFTFRAYDVLPDKEIESDSYYDRTKNAVTVIVSADDEQDAEKDAKTLVMREVFKLLSVTELSEDYLPIQS